MRGMLDSPSSPAQVALFGMVVVFMRQDPPEANATGTSASPVATVTAPLLLPLLVPDEKEIAPLDPLAPALALRMLKEPLDVALP